MGKKIFVAKGQDVVCEFIRPMVVIFCPVFGIGLQKKPMSAFGIFRMGLKPQSQSTGRRTG
ncbi:MAG: hypothetical protein KJ826_15280 [Proteobacteria bacterium]|nr:hypothetical protein [Pseudomonadota bacterium]